MSSLSGLLRERGWTIASVILVGVVLFAVVDVLHSFLCYGVAAAINVTSYLAYTAQQLDPSIAVEAEPVAVSNYTAVVARARHSEGAVTFTDSVYGALVWFLKQLLVLLSRKELFTALLVLGFAIAVYEQLMGEE